MARLFERASSQYLQLGSAPLTGAPISVSFWFNADNDIDNLTVFSLANSGAVAENFEIELSGAVALDPIRVSTRTVAGGSVTANTTIAYPLNSWHHGMGIYEAVDSRIAYLDGGNKGTNTNSRTPTGIDTLTWGSRTQILNYMSGGLAELALWNVALSEAEVKLLALRLLSPLLVRRGNLVFYAPLTYRSRDFDIVGNLNMTAYNSPSWAEHPSGLTYPEPAHPMIKEQLPYFWTLPVAEEEGPTTVFPFSDNFTGTNNDPWDATKWLTSVA